MPKRTLQGVVVSDKQDKTVEVRVELANQDGQVKVAGSAVAALPSR